MLYIIISAWALSGVSFWVYGCCKVGWPDRWHSRDNRKEGWDETIFVTIPICILAGPIFWAVSAYDKIIGLP